MRRTALSSSSRSSGRNARITIERPSRNVAVAEYRAGSIKVPMQARSDDKQCPGVLRDHQFLVCGDDPSGHAASRGSDARTSLGVRGGVDLDAKPGSVAANTLADW